MNEIKTKRLLLRKFRPDEAQAVFDAWASDPAVTRYLTWNPHESVEITQCILNGWTEDYSRPDCFRWAIENMETGLLMGSIDVVGFHRGNPVIGYVLGRKHWGNGYMTEACGAVVRELFACGYETICIGAHEDNIGSNRVIRKCGFRFIGKFSRPMSDRKPEIVTINEYRINRDNSLVYMAESGAGFEVARMAAGLWPGHPEGELAEEFEEAFRNPESAVFIALREGKNAGFAYMTLRRDFVEGTHASPVAYLEGIYVDPAYRGKGVAASLLTACEARGRTLGCTELASDCELDNADSIAFHASAGFSEANRIVCFVKPL